ncbi:MAG: gliding motility-associated C-terminal domain-containing protein [Bacteroidales bacterium]|nr:gliding motility-associated C-terminal domain-containing protein [Bacteroidales bacterium]
MKRLFFLSFLFLSYIAQCQITVVVKPADTMLCFRDSIEFTTEVTKSGTGFLTYQWQKNLINIPGATDSIYKIQQVKPVDVAIYSCIATYAGISDTSNDARLRIHPPMKIDTLYRYNPLGCSGECKGQFKALASGGTPFKNYPPYIYDWNGGHSQDTIVFGLCPGKYTLDVIDSVGCVLDTAYFVDVLKSPKVDFTILPKDTVYLTNPNIQVTYPDSMKIHITNWTWDFGDDIKVPNLNPLTHTYSKTGLFPVRLSFTDNNGCDTTITHEVTVRVAELVIPNVFTPNADGHNDYFVIKIKDAGKEPSGEEVDYRLAYLNTELVVFDRWGRKVFDHLNYQSGDWDGANLSDGTYFYILKCQGQYGDDVFRGSLTILRGEQQSN